MPQAVPVGRLKKLPICAQAEDRIACSGEPPLIAPVRKSDTNGQVPMIAGAPGLIALT